MKRLLLFPVLAGLWTGILVSFAMGLALYHPSGSSVSIDRVADVVAIWALVGIPVVCVGVRERKRRREQESASPSRFVGVVRASPPISLPGDGFPSRPNRGPLRRVQSPCRSFRGRRADCPNGRHECGRNRGIQPNDPFRKRHLLGLLQVHRVSGHRLVARRQTDRANLRPPRKGDLVGRLFR